jgi:hypothetical protein
MARSALAVRQGEAFYETSGGSVLHEVSPFAPREIQRPDPMWGDLSSHLEERLSMLRNWRLSWWQHWALLAKFILPRRYHWLITANTMTRGNQLNQEIVDATGTLAMRTCAAGMMSGLTSPNRPWFRLRSAIPNFEPDRAAQMWFEDVAERLRFIHAESNFYDSLAQMYEDLVTFGTSPVIDYEDEEDIIRCYNPCAGEYFLGVGFDFRHEVFYREFTLTVSQIVEMFGIDRVGPDIASMWQTKGGSLEQERVIAHAIEPNFPIVGRGNREVAPLNGWPWREAYWLRGSPGNNPLSLRGFHEMPFTAPRWSTVSNDAYGRSPCMDGLPDIMQLQTETKRKAEAIEKHVRPPMLASVSLKNEPSSILPGHITYVPTMGPGEGMRPVYEVQPDLAAMAADIAQIQQRIQVHLYNDLFKMISSLDSVERRTATEIDARREEKLVLLGPVIERLQNEGLSPRIRRHIAIMARKGLLPPMPPSLRGHPIEIEYVSMLAIAQRAAATAGIERWVAFTGNLAAADPTSLSPPTDNIDKDATSRYYSELMGVPPKLVTDPRVLAQIRDGRAKQAQAAQMAQTAQAGVQGAQVLSQTDVGGGANALQAMLGNGPAQGNA